MPRRAYQDDLEAAHGRIRALEQDNQALKAQLAGGSIGLRPRGHRVMFLLMVSFLVLAGGSVLVLARIGGVRGALAGFGVLFLVALPVILLTRLFYVCGPNEALIVSGRQHRGADGVVRGYQIVCGGRVLRIPFVDQVHRFDLGLIRFDLQITSAYTAGGLPVDITAHGAVRVGEGVLLFNAVERFLGQDRQELAQVARDTVAAGLRTVAANLTFDELRQDPAQVAATLLNLKVDDLQRLGLVLELFELQSVSHSS